MANLTGALQVLARKTADPGAFVARVSESSKRVGASAELVGVVLLRRETGWPPRAELEARVRADAGFQALPGDRKTMVYCQRKRDKLSPPARFGHALRGLRRRRTAPSASPWRWVIRDAERKLRGPRARRL